VNGLDTNVLIRYIVQDDAAQSAAATKLIENRCTRQTPGFVSHLVLAELTWVLHRGYGYGRDTIQDILAGLLSSVELQVQEPATAWRALQAFRKGNADFADYLIGCIHEAHGCQATWTFDQKAAQSFVHQLVRE
jgi:predicted nucleic-acid-binding protein